MRFGALDCLRGVCATIVVLVHVEIIGLIDIGHFHHLKFLDNSFHLVDFFFVLSGFVISYSSIDRIGTRDQAVSFMLRRFGRVYPVHLLMLGLFIALECSRVFRLRHGIYVPEGMTEPVAFVGSTAWQAIIPNLLLIQSLGLFETTTWNTPSWSISCEFYTYLVFALFALWAKAWTRTTILVALGLSLGSGLIVLCFAPYYMFSMQDYGFFRCMYGFFLGCVAHAVYPSIAKIHLDRKWLNTSLEAGILVLSIVFVWTTCEIALSVASPLVFFLLVLIFARQAGLVSKLVINRPFEFLGEISFTIYITHAFIITLAMMVITFLAAHHYLGTSFEPGVGVHDIPVRLLHLANPWVADAITVGLVAISIAASVYVQRWVENPGRRFFNRLADPKKYAAQERAAASAAGASDVARDPSTGVSKPA